MTQSRDWDARADELWAGAERGEVDTPWDRDAPSPPVVDRVAALGDGAGRRAVVVGAGLGADAEHLAEKGWRTTAFDISPAAVRTVRARRPDSGVDYRVADLLDLPDDLVGAFDLVVEVYTVQAMSRSLRTAAITGVRRLLAPGGTLVVVQFVRGDRPAEQGPPWLLDRAEVESFAADDVTLLELTDVPHATRPDGPRQWVAVLVRAG